MNTHNNNTFDVIAMICIWLFQGLIAFTNQAFQLSFEDVTDIIFRILQIIAVIFSIYASYMIAKKNKDEHNKKV
jgi:hypothetical protein